MLALEQTAILQVFGVALVWVVNSFTEIKKIPNVKNTLSDHDSIHRLDGQTCARAPVSEKVTDSTPITLQLSLPNIFIQLLRRQQLGKLNKKKKKKKKTTKVREKRISSSILIFPKNLLHCLSPQRGSNSRPLVYKTSALTTELWRRPTSILAERERE